MSGSFWAKSFIWNDVPSEYYSLTVSNFDIGVISTSAGSDVEIIEQEIYRRPKPYFFGISQRPKLEFDFTVTSENALSATDRNLIESWLLGNMNYGILQFVSCDMDDVYFRGILSKASNIYTGNLNYGLNLHMICDSPWAWRYPITSNYIYPNNTIVNVNIPYINRSANNDYTKPIIQFILNTIGNSFKLTNLSDTTQGSFEFTALSPSETITVNNDLETIVSSTGLYRISKFNKNWFYLIPGLNNLNIQSGIGTFSMTVQDAVKLGG